MFRLAIIALLIVTASYNYCEAGCGCAKRRSRATTKPTTTRPNTTKKVVKKTTEKRNVVTK